MESDEDAVLNISTSAQLAFVMASDFKPERNPGNLHTFLLYVMRISFPHKSNVCKYFVMLSPNIISDPSLISLYMHLSSSHSFKQREILWLLDL